MSSNLFLCVILFGDIVREHRGIILVCKGIGSEKIFSAEISWCAIRYILLSSSHVLCSLWSTDQWSCALPQEDHKVTKESAWYLYVKTTRGKQIGKIWWSLLSLTKSSCTILCKSSEQVSSAICSDVQIYEVWTWK